MLRASISEPNKHTSRTAIDTDTDFDDLLTLTDAKNHLGVLSDTTDDTLITHLIITAIKQVEAFLSDVLLSRDVIDYYGAFNRSYQLSSKAVTDTSTITLKYIDEDGTEQSTTDNLAFDKTEKIPTVYHTGDIPKTKLSTYVRNPVSVTYTSNIRHAISEPATQAVLYLVNQWYYDRGDVVDNVDYRHIWKLLTPYKNIVG